MNLRVAVSMMPSFQIELKDRQFNEFLSDVNANQCVQDSLYGTYFFLSEWSEYLFWNAYSYGYSIQWKCSRSFSSTSSYLSVMLAIYNVFKLCGILYSLLSDSIHLYLSIWVYARLFFFYTNLTLYMFTSKCIIEFF